MTVDCLKNAAVGTATSVKKLLIKRRVCAVVPRQLRKECDLPELHRRTALQLHSSYRPSALDDTLIISF